MKTRIVVICGPTAVGKTSFAIRLAQKYNGEIISADSMQIYRYMDIGTAKPSAEELNSIPHHLIDIINPNEVFDAARFVDAADQKIEEIISRRKLPFIVGGTGLYIKSLIYGLFETPPCTVEIRVSLKKLAEKKGLIYLYQHLHQVDPIAAEKISENDSQRIIRALEVYHTTGRSISSLQSEHGFREKRYTSLNLCLSEDRNVLYQRINDRVDQMVQGGFLKEVQNLLEKGFDPSLKSMNSIGYKHMVSYIEGHNSLEDAIDKMKRDTRRYAKRQLTWFRKTPDIHWVSLCDIRGASALIAPFIQGASK